MPSKGLDERQWRYTRLHLNHLREELRSLLSWLEEDTEATKKDYPSVPAGFRAHDKFWDYAEHVRQETSLLEELLRKLNANHAFDTEEDSFWHGLEDFEEDLRSGVYALPTELQRELDRDDGCVWDDEM